eukprot:scaffold261742_cov31-Tisochrysis_lutea.AAC.1
MFKTDDFLSLGRSQERVYKAKCLLCFTFLLVFFGSLLLLHWLAKFTWLRFSPQPPPPREPPPSPHGAVAGEAIAPTSSRPTTKRRFSPCGFIGSSFSLFVRSSEIYCIDLCRRVSKARVGATAITRPQTKNWVQLVWYR